MTYRLNLYLGSKLSITEFLDASLEGAKQLACAALDMGYAHRAEVVDCAGVIKFQRWAVL